MLDGYVIFVNRVGEQKDLVFLGYSPVGDPWGNVVSEGPGREEALIIADIDPSKVRRRRRECPWSRRPASPFSAENSTVWPKKAVTSEQQRVASCAGKDLSCGCQAYTKNSVLTIRR
jgi:hypothetical protein